MATIRDVAKQAGVSIATVSRALNNKNLVADDTYERIKDAIQLLGYEHTTRSAVRSGSSRIILSTHLGNDYAYAMQHRAAELNYEFLTVPIGYSVEEQRDALHTLDWFYRAHRDQLAGLILAPHLTQLSRDLLDFFELLPVVQLNQSTPLNRMYQVISNIFEPVIEMIGKLYADGRHRIALLTNDYISSLNVLWKKTRGAYCNAACDLGLPLLIYSLPVTPDEVGPSLSPILDGDDRPDAFICMGPDIVHGCMDELLSRGINVQEDVSVVAISMTGVISHLGNPLPTLTIDNIDQLAREAVNLLHAIDSGAVTSDRQISLPTYMFYPSTHDAL